MLEHAKLGRKPVDERFEDRAAAGRALAEALSVYRGRRDTLVLGLARGGLPVASEVARALDAELDVLVVRKIGAPAQPELAIGAIASGGAQVLNEHIIAALGLDQSTVQRAAQQAQNALEVREQRYRGSRLPPRIKGRTVIVIDDGVATGATLEAAVRSIRAQEPAELITAVPVASPQAQRRLQRISDQFVALQLPAGFSAVGQWYYRFDQISDEEVARLLDHAGRPPRARGESTQTRSDSFPQATRQ